jgi:hypothetical protein
VDRRQLPLRDLLAQAQRQHVVRTGAGERCFHAVEPAQFLVGGQGRMVRDVVGGAGEIVKGHDHRPVPRAHKARGDREVLVAVPLAGPVVCRLNHHTFLQAEFQALFA